MKIQLLANCSILIEYKNSRILLDPYFHGNGNIIHKRVDKPSVDYKDIEELNGILISHTHFDHMDSKFLKKFNGKCEIYMPRLTMAHLFYKSKIAKKGRKFRLGDFKIEVVEAHHVCPAVGYIIKAGNEVIYFSGDTYYGDFMMRLSEKYNITIAILPVTHFLPKMTMWQKDILKAVKVLKPEIFIPMHLDLVPRFSIINTEIDIMSLDKKINEKTSTQLIYLKNGDFFDMNDI